jgi:3-oxoadipate enol-lactonase
MSISYLRQGGGDPVVFLHGIGGGARSFHHQLDGLSDAFDCIAWDAPGFGNSPPLPSVTFEALAASLAELLDQLALKSAHLVGHSLGGMIAQEFVARYPDRVRSLVLSCTSPAFGRPDGDFQRQFIEARLGPIERGLSMAENAQAVIPALMARAAPQDVALAIDCMAQIPVSTYKATVQCLVQFDRRASLPDIKVPTLALAAERDQAAPPAVLEKMAGKIPGARYVCIPAVGHLANIEDPATYNAEVRRFIGQRARCR